MPEDVRTKCVYITCIIRVNGRRIPRFHRYGIERSQEETLWFRGEAGDILFFFVALKIFFFFSSNLLQEISNGVNVKKLLNIWLSTTNASEIIFFISVLVGMQKKKKKKYPCQIISHLQLFDLDQYLQMLTVDERFPLHWESSVIIKLIV